ncbi:MAG: hypothetical protein OHK0015_03780 [Chloroflexi bacterium OHK40]
MAERAGRPRAAAMPPWIAHTTCRSPPIVALMAQPRRSWRDTMQMLPAPPIRTQHAAALCMPPNDVCGSIERPASAAWVVCPSPGPLSGSHNQGNSGTIRP